MTIGDAITILGTIIAVIIATIIIVSKGGQD